MGFKILDDPTSVEDEIGEATVPVVVHYCFPGMGESSLVMPLLEALAEEKVDTVQFVISETGEVPPGYAPSDIPLTILYEMGNVVYSTTGDDDPALEELAERLRPL
ncbi:hypothetical protein N7468_006832 [Penicillium chermesinum]|uniref:Uncharacterized protein n=1 Tax=Penicillium chermesinum TaxID=63820 RepID=A0A9W9NT16_9EURO|nr:uncharacterized protein N7468_006832 [Penicillium chermesinum]KAJ5225607.1 hypothetical protein N7468_006832 [Penicillium chermesinum]KAJ6161173.1 hypothetical protein N7470_004569 [Penicillium chermesinum]